MKNLINFVKRFRKTAWTFGLTALIVVVALASGGSDWFQTLTISKSLIMKASAKQTFATGAFAFFDKASYIALGDSAYLSVGGKIADTSAFTTSGTTKVISIPGASASDAYIITHRQIIANGVVAATDTAILSYMAKTDTLVVSRARGGLSGGKFSWFRVSLR